MHLLINTWHFRLKCVSITNRDLNIRENWLRNSNLSQKKKHFSHVKCHSSLERTAIEAIVPGRRDKGWHKVVMKLSTWNIWSKGTGGRQEFLTAFYDVSAKLQKVLETKFSRKRCALYLSKYSHCFTNCLICLSIIRKKWELLWEKLWERFCLALSKSR